MRLFVALLFQIIHGLSVLKSDQCLDCSLLIRKEDCEFANCFWSAVGENQEGTCGDEDLSENPGNSEGNVSFCQSVLNPEQNCNKVKGCAYYNSTCTIFTGCSAYFLHTTIDCQKISSECISEGDGCINVKQCVEYLTQDICENSGSSSGFGKCKWNSELQKCRDYQCSEADLVLTTDQQCSQFGVGCITKGQGCIESPLRECKTYETSGQDCSKLIGSDGQCEQVEGSQYCQLKKCETAPTTYNNNEECDKYLKGCVSTGQGCVVSLVPCNTYKKDCTNYIGSDGICEYEENQENCRSRICENGQFTSDEDCNRYKTGCITNGKSCASSLQSCTSYKGNKNSCLGYKGQEGMCKGIDDNEQQCQVQDCIKDSSTAYVTDEQCQNIQKVCKTNGMGCVYTLKVCKEYEASPEKCFGLIGSDGRCQGGADGKCKSRICSDAPSTYNTDYECKKYQSGCVTNDKLLIDSQREQLFRYCRMLMEFILHGFNKMFQFLNSIDL
ncbi:unnamed protein product [Paramecium octaurelia]|uniref:Uncharacterized protein n=1 Tax=Paramecium octaurelia TaxID=43137 RepID=A0A8S1W044_PAROT|nr:unnamed protein product [Paramecium octaurelia]